MPTISRRIHSGIHTRESNKRRLTRLCIRCWARIAAVAATLNDGIKDGAAMVGLGIAQEQPVPLAAALR